MVTGLAVQKLSKTKALAAECCLRYQTWHFMRSVAMSPAILLSHLPAWTGLSPTKTQPNPSRTPLCPALGPPVGPHAASAAVSGAKHVSSIAYHSCPQRSKPCFRRRSGCGVRNVSAKNPIRANEGFAVDARHTSHREPRSSCISPSRLPVGRSMHPNRCRQPVTHTVTAPRWYPHPNAMAFFAPAPCPKELVRWHSGRLKTGPLAAHSVATPAADAHP